MPSLYAVRAPCKLCIYVLTRVRFLPHSPFRINNLARGASAEEAVKLVREGKAEMLMKGSLHTDELMSAVVKRETGLRTERRISHYFVMDVPSLDRATIITNAAARPGISTPASRVPMGDSDE